MSLKPIDYEIEKSKKILDRWNQYAPEIERVRRLEMGTMMTPKAEMDEGYYPLRAVRGYHQIINAYQLLGNITAAQCDKLTEVAKVLEGLQSDQTLLGNTPTPGAIKRYSAIKMEELERTGETYYISGHATHFNITKIKQQPDGGYTYTLYDAGHESKVVGMEDGRHLINAVQERKILPGTDLRALLETEIAKKVSEHTSPEYAAAKKAIRQALKDPPIRVEQDYGQRKSNCTTRGQRILAADIMQDDKLSEGLYDFASNVQGTSTNEIKEALERRLAHLVDIRDGTKPGAAEGVDVYNFIKAADAKSYEHVNIGLDGGGMMAAYRTTPGLFGEAELENLQGMLERNGVKAAVRESVSSPGKFYLYVPEENAGDIASALKEDKSLVAGLYRRYGPHAPQYIDEIAPKPPKPPEPPLALLGDVDRWQASATGDGVPVTRIALVEMPEAEVKKLEDILIRNGFTPMRCESASMGPTLRLQGDDVAKFARWQQQLPGQVAAQILGAGPWHDATKEGGGIITRIATGGMDAGQVGQLVEMLKEAGLKPELRNSESMGQTIRLEGKDAVKIQEMRNGTIKNANWQPAASSHGLLLRVATGGMGGMQVAALMHSLEAEGFSPAERDSSTIGRNIRLKEGDVGMLQEILKKRGVAAPAGDVPEVKGSKFAAKVPADAPKTPPQKIKNPVLG